MKYTVVLVDDDRQALEILSYQLNQYPEIKIAGCFTEPQAALDTIGKEPPDMVFLDIDMPQIAGIDLAVRINEIQPDIDVIFVTSHSKYALDAFDLNALDYLVKPLNKNRLGKTIQRFLNKKSSASESKDVLADTLEIKCFGQFQIKFRGIPLKWRSHKTKELAAFLIHNMDRNISRDEILDTLWPDEDIDKAANRLYSTIHYLRKAFKACCIKREMIRINGKYSGQYSISMGEGVITDMCRFESLVSDMDSETDIKALEVAEALYAGEYMEGESWLWAYSLKERLNNLYIKLITELSGRYLVDAAYVKAENILLKAFKQHSYEEKVTFLLLKVYKASQQKAKAVRHFSIYKKVLAEELDITPEQHIQDLFNSIN